MIPQTLSVKQAAEHFNVKPRTVRNWIARGHLSASRIGKCYFINAEEISKVLDETQAKATAAQQEQIAWANEFIALFRGPKVMDKERTRADRRRELEYENKRSRGCGP